MSSGHISQNLQQRNPVTKEAHRRQTFFQIYLPLIIIAVLVILTMVLVLLNQNEQLSKWSDITLILLISILLVVTLLVIAGVIIASVYLTRLLKASPYFFFKVQRITFIMEVRSRAIGNSIVEPVLKVNSFIAGALALRRK